MPGSATIALSDLVPSWLQASYSNSHIQSVLTALAEREAARLSLRMDSVQAARASNTPGPTNESYYSVVTAVQPENIRKNRYTDVLPYDRTRVRVKDAMTGGETYLNANWVQEKYGQKLWIASQAALPRTTYTFLSLLLDSGGAVPPSPVTTNGTPSDPSPSLTKAALIRPRTVVQLTQNVESGHRKAHPYFPDVIGQTMIITPDTLELPPSPMPQALKVTLLAQERIQEACCVKSVVEVKPIADAPASVSSSVTAPKYNADDSEDEYGEDGQSLQHNQTSRPTIFTHLMYHAWPDHSVPSPADRAALFEFVQLVEQVNRTPSGSNMGYVSSSDSTEDPPVIVGCSAGIGRTGSFVAMSSLLRQAGFLSPAKGGINLTSDSTTTDVNGHFSPLPPNLANDLVAQEIDSLREQRPGMVQRPEQAVLVYEMMMGAYVGRR
ncbi:hypothetical protein D9757_006975 [Collybiopsis confluens]|uniref:Phosphatases II n=1 Tax=Collybiopsis confluens TaxID=2823264 RepID=A0A8H5HIZ8_9AGAR|nr:hypothetical protein D9757_006975 [Collybiopsis confluens]